MRFLSFFIPILVCCVLLLNGCSGSGNAPLSPDLNSDQLACKDSGETADSGSTQLWGYYDVYVDVEKMEATAVLNRSAMFTANCVNILNGSLGSGVYIEIHNIEYEIDYLGIDLKVSLRHPFPGLDHYAGYDVRGVFMGDGTGVMAYNPDLKYPVVGTDQSFEPDPTDPDGSDGHPDGYTRWFNYSEFQGPGMPLFTYTKGNLASPAFEGTATLCPYKYFADGLESDGSVTEFLENNVSDHGVFSAGAINSRDYKLRFPKSIPVVFGYAVVANWEGPDIHPANAPEAVGCRVLQTEEPYYIDSTEWGGDIGLTLDIFDWGASVTSGAMEDYRIHIESNALSTVYQFDDTEMMPIGGGENYSTFSVEMPVDNLNEVEGNEYWVIVECADADYTNDLGVLNDAWEDPLAAFFRFDLNVSNLNPTQAPVCDLIVNPCTLHYWDITDHVAVEFDASGSFDPDGDPITFHWDFDGDDVYDELVDDEYTGTPDKPSHVYYEDGIANLKVEDDHGASSICQVDVDITEHASKNIPLVEGWIARDLAVDPSNGELHILLYKNEGEDNYCQTWKYSPCDLYTQPGAPFHVTNEGAMYFRIDVSSTHYSLIGGAHEGCSGKVRNITPDGVDIGPNWVIHTQDLWAFNDSDKWPLDHVTLYGWDSPPWNPGGHNTYVYRSPYNTVFDTWIQAANIYWGPDDPWIGHDKLFGNYVIGVEPVAYGNSFWCLKDPGNASINDYYITRWRLDDPGTFTGVNYDGAWYGAGMQTESDDGWYEAKDLTRNVDDTLLVLDELSDGTGRVKAFVGDDTGGYAVGAFNVPDEVNSKPVRIDSSDYVDPVYGNLIYILHGDSSSGFLLSIVFPEELPW